MNDKEKTHFMVASILTLCTKPKTWEEAPKQLVEIRIPPIVDRVIKILSESTHNKFSEAQVMSDLLLDLILKGIAVLASERSPEDVAKGLLEVEQAVEEIRDAKTQNNNRG